MIINDHLVKCKFKDIKRLNKLLLRLANYSQPLHWESHSFDMCLTSRVDGLSITSIGVVYNWMLLTQEWRNGLWGYTNNINNNNKDDNYNNNDYNNYIIII